MRRPNHGLFGDERCAIRSASAILGVSRVSLVPPFSDPALRALFAPYCGGLAREPELEDALQRLRGLGFHGLRPVAGANGHRYILRWESVQAPMELTRCDLDFPENPELHYRFELVTHQLVAWLMDCSDAEGQGVDLPDAFWHWLLIGSDPDQMGDDTPSGP